MYKVSEEMADIKNADKKYPYKVNFGRFVKRKMKSKHTSSGNEIVTSHYTKANWFPMALLAQLRKPVIIYFVIITIIRCLPFSGQDPSFLIITLVVVILFSMVRELFEDLKRQKLDQQQNKSKGNIYRYTWLSFEERLWDEVRVGDIVAVHQGEEVPADLCFIHSPTNNAFIDTSNIDGETGL